MAPEMPPGGQGPGRDGRWREDAAGPGEPAPGGADARWARLWRDVRAGAEAEAHPVDPGALGEYAVLLRRSEGAARARFPDVAAHLATGCASCAEDLADLLAAIDGGALAAPDDGSEETALGTLRRVIATRLLPLPGMLPAGLRGATRPGGGEGTTHTTYQTDDVTVVLEQERGPRSTAVVIRGVVMTRPSEAASLSDGEARMWASSGAGAHDGGGYEARIDELGDFVLEGVAPGTYRLELTLGASVVVVDDLQVGPPDGAPSGPPPPGGA